MNTQLDGPEEARGITTVFVVEDEALIAMELEDHLTAGGYNVIGTATNGEQALPAIIATRPDIVVMDIHLAGELDGIETAALIAKRADIPIIFLSAFSDAELLKKAREVEPFGYIIKPFEPQELHATIQTALSKHRMDRA